MSLLTPTSTSIPLHAEIPSMDESMAEIEQKQPKKKKEKKHQIMMMIGKNT